jgi:citrate synthase
MNTIELDLNDLFSTRVDGKYTILEFKKPNVNVIIYDPGLYHTAICKSALCRIDKEDGKLYYRGISADEKIHEDYLDVAFEIIFDTGEEDKKRFKEMVDVHFQLYDEQKVLLDALPLSAHPMDILEIATTALNGIEKKYLRDPEDLIEKAAFLVASVAIHVSYRFTKLNNTPWIPPRLSLPYSERILYQMHSGKDSARLKKLGKILNMIMILHAEHGQNCSAATVRCIASAKGSIYSGIAGGMAAFNGAIHGGASQLVSAMYEELLESNLDVDHYVKGKLEKKELLMGFGQRTYNRILGCWDPRVEKMYQTLTDPEFDFPEVARYKQAAIQLIERVTSDPFFKARNLTPNPDLFNCIFYKLFGVPREMNTVMLGLGRIAGWTANFIEHTADHIPLTRPCDIEK